ncbi:MAG: iron-containing alcohol dehydrogenase family protein [Thermosulfidibacteraceae bacterium]
MAWEWYHPVKVYFGENFFYKLKDLSLDKPVAVITGKKNVKERGIVGRLEELIGNDFTLLDFVEGEPTWEVIEKLRDRLSEEGVKTVISIGGGSVLDSAKLAALLVTNKGVKIREIIGVRDFKFENSPLRVIAVPTTSGSGSEVTPYSIVIDRENLKKASIGSLYLYPFIAIDDPTLTYDTPFEITRNSGIDAFCHSLEVFFMKEIHPIASNFALNGILLFIKFFMNALNNDRIARAKMMLSSLYGGYAISNVGAGLIHQFAHALGVLRGYPHGFAIAIYVVPVLSWYAEYKEGLERIKLLEDNLGIKGLIMYLRKLFGDIGIPDVGKIGLGEKEIELMVSIVERRKTYFDKFVVTPKRDDLYRIALGGFEASL